MDPMIALHYGGHWRLKNVQPGALFLLNSGGIGLKTEYGSSAYLLGSGETCVASPDEIVIVLTPVVNDLASYRWEVK